MNAADESAVGDRVRVGSGAVVVAGGYGEVGALLARRLAPRLPSRVVIAGRDKGRATAVADRIGHGARAEVLDAESPRSIEALLERERPVVIIACLARTGPLLAHACLAAAIHYVDITADAQVIAAVEGLNSAARSSGATAVLSVGLAPGLTNLLAHQVCGSMDDVACLDIGVQLGVGDAHGEAALAWTLDNLAAPYSVVRGGTAVPARPFDRRRRLDFGGASPVLAGAFNFPEQRTLARTLGAPTVRSWLSLGPPPAHAAIVLAARSRTAGALNRPYVREPLLGALRRLPRRQGGWAVCAEAIGTRNELPLRVVARRRGQGEAAMTARIADYVTIRLLDGKQPSGVWHIEQLPEPEALLAALSR